jgi:8-oxo-dGTP diphosphatase
MKKTRFRSHVAVCLLLIKGDEILLLKRANTGWGDGCYALPGGAIDGGETLKSAMIREAKEEIGIVLDPSDLKMVHLTHVAATKAHPHETVVIFFQSSKYSGTIENKEPHKCSEVAFFPIRALPENTLRLGSSAIMNFLNNVNYDEALWDEYSCSE